MAITRLKYITTNLVQDVTPTVAGFAASINYPVSSITNWRMSKRAGFTTAKIGTLVFDLGSAKTIKACFLFNHNFSATAVIKIQGHTSDSWATPDVDETITYAEFDMHKEFTGASKQFWRLSVSDASRASADIKIGEIILGEVVTLTRNPDWDISEITVYNNVEHITVGGNRWVYNLYNTKSWSLSFAELLSAQNTMVKNMLVNSSGSGYPFAIIFESTPYYVRCQSSYETSRPIPVGNIESGFETNHPVEYGVSDFILTEESRGITV